MRRTSAVLFISVLTLAGVAVACDPSANCPVAGLPTTAGYEIIPGVPLDDVSVDIHAPAGVCNAPVVMWVHGGGYQTGDKSNQMTDKVNHFNSQGWMLVSVNYRLTVAGDPASAHFPDHYDDVATAVAWVHAHIGLWGGDPDRIALLGHSAGADIVSNVANNPQYLRDQGLDLDVLSCAGPLDTEGFDKAAANPTEQTQWIVALGNNPNYVAETSATRIATAGTGIPPTIGVYRGTARRQQIENGYLDKLSSIGVPTTRIDARTLTHGEVNSDIGSPGDTVMTPPLTSFLATCFA